MHPVLFQFGPVAVRFYGLMYVVAILVASVLITKEVKRKKIALTQDDVMNFIIWTVVGGIIGARAYYVAFNWDYYGANPFEIPAVWHGGLAIHGGLLGGISAAWLFLRRKSIAFWRMADAVAPSIILGQAFGRFGNFMNGDAHGRPTDLPWGIVFPPGSIAGSEFPGIPLHPVMLYEMLINLGIFSFLWFYLKKREHKSGFIFAVYLTLYSIGRFVVEGFRADSLMMDSMKAAQAVSVSIAAVSVIVIVSRRLWKA
ncbi:MAG TPA: prolipoprotein diacylglyceryl transferase [Deltaproteobacteria bacterium]|nr:MAG: prolipoprotein diacylglyceryl transferase [Deltaproteobacteria bacterium GWA2_55_82]OGQ62586.1 MAG: prolipoprotein diacylglyceryl transferase [Deltaproteobacteria bacterium RIFCSPLOWO2_02_FULL_55_12]OIJ74175.1 MAG: prolipoprotein diacylglyceryl transferase [Deltaproteobacteria bacterium GWC2_55_46]HBG46797.1 prolipoprotein diacylglyceryl transferase [Deltaproteobacteria bacterium]HCY11194.1 prolipoprotein diacylglyceryl transferase [Deltaproteobacteria bacterium]